MVNQAAVFCVRIALKVTYEHLRFEKFFRGLYPGPPLKGREDMGRERKGRERREGSGAPRFSLVPTASLGLATALCRPYNCYNQFVYYFIIFIRSQFAVMS
jgi:hypothetical protein